MKVKNILSILVGITGLLSCTKADFNSWSYSIESPGNSHKTRTISQEDSVSYSQVLQDSVVLEEEWHLPSFSILKRNGENGLEYTVLNSYFQGFRAIQNYADSSYYKGQTEIIDGITCKLQVLELQSGYLGAWIDSSQSNVLEEFPDLEGRAVRINRFVGEERESWELIEESRSVIPPIDTSGSFVFPEVWLVDPRVGTPQVNNFLLEFEIEDWETKLPLTNTHVCITRNDTVYFDTSAEKTDQIKIYLPIDHKVLVEVGADDYLSKSVALDLRNVPAERQEGGFSTILNFTLFKDQDGFDKSLLDLPLGKAKYNEELNNIEFDLDYSRSRQTLILESLQTH